MAIRDVGGQMVLLKCLYRRLWLPLSRPQVLGESFGMVGLRPL